MEERTYFCIDLKSFYASVECVERGLDPLSTALVVADPERGPGTICLAVSPQLRRMGIPGRCRVFELPAGLSYIMAPPRMRLYMEYAARIYGIYLRYFSAEDIHVYSIDEVFIDITSYRRLYETDARRLALRVMNEILKETGIRSTCGIGSNLYLAKIALDIKAKSAPDYVFELDECSYRRLLWEHRPLSDFWRIGTGIQARLARYQLYTMRDIAMADEALLYRLFGVDAELLIDHAWGRESTSIADIHAYTPKAHSLFRSQVLQRDYAAAEARTLVKEMSESLALELFAAGLSASAVQLSVGFGGHRQPSVLSGSQRLETPGNTASVLTEAFIRIYDGMVTDGMEIRRLSLQCLQVEQRTAYQLSLFEDVGRRVKEEQLQTAILSVHRRYGRNALLRAHSLEEGATARERNQQIGGHKSGETSAS